MSTSEENGRSRLTRRQLREIRLTGSTPVITDEEASAAAAQPTTVLPRAAEPVEIPPAPQVDQPSPGAPLTRRQMRALEHAREAEAASASGTAEEPQEPEETPAEAAHEEAAHEAEQQQAPVDRAQVAAIFGGTADADRQAAPAVDGEAPDAVSAAEPPDATEGGTAPETGGLIASVPAAETEPAERPKVGAAFGIGVKTGRAESAAGPLFDELLEGDTSTSQHGTSTALIFTPSPGMGSLSGPIASTGELLITGTYSLPEGLGSQGHARGTADGRDVDAVLIDGELAPASSPTPIAASAAVSTSKQAGEVIRPPAPDKGNKLMLTLAVVAGGLAIVLAATLVIAFTSGVFG